MVTTRASAGGTLGLDGLEVQTVGKCQDRIAGLLFILQGREKEMDFVLVAEVWGVMYTNMRISS